MDYRVSEIGESHLKRRIADEILRALPEWFGIEAAIVDYVKQSEDMPFWAAYVRDRPVGFLYMRRHNPFTSEIYCMGVLQEFHHQGIGRALVGACEKRCDEEGAEFLTVKTLDASRPDDGYAKTRQFYLAMGFRPLEVFPTLWGEDNPCLFMGKRLGHPARSG